MVKLYISWYDIITFELINRFLFSFLYGWWFDRYVLIWIVPKVYSARDSSVNYLLNFYYTVESILMKFFVPIPEDSIRNSKKNKSNCVANWLNLRR